LRRIFEQRLRDNCFAVLPADDFGNCAMLLLCDRPIVARIPRNMTLGEIDQSAMHGGRFR